MKVLGRWVVIGLLAMVLAAGPCVVHSSVAQHAASASHAHHQALSSHADHHAGASGLHAGHHLAPATADHYGDSRPQPDGLCMVASCAALTAPSSEPALHLFALAGGLEPSITTPLHPTSLVFEIFRPPRAD